VVLAPSKRQDGCMLDDVVDLTRALIQIDTSNFGDHADTVGEREAAEYCAERLREVGWDPEVLTTVSDQRAGMYLRIPGTDPTAPALVVHGHLDVVPAIAADWTHPPFAGEVADGCIWGRGAVDMKNMDAMILAVVREWGRSGFRPRRDTIIMFFPDEEAGMVHGSQWFGDHRPDLFRGASEAIGEVGGFSMTVRDDLRVYPIQTGEKGLRWLRLRSRKRAGHGSMLHRDNAILDIADAVQRIGAYEWPRRYTQTTDRFLHDLSEAYDIDLSALEPHELPEVLGTIGFLVGATMQNTANPSMLSAGYKVNVIPEVAEAAIDGRFLPGFEQEFDETIRELVGDRVEVESISDGIAIEAAFDTTTVDLMRRCLLESDPEARIVPYLISGGTDAKALSGLGIECYGFSPLQMPADMDYWRMFHGVDERVPIAGLHFGVTVLDRFLRSA
jgi:acetylornithine deacetylase/succinyl-diaminopimelate desuccinylase-like protein